MSLAQVPDESVTALRGEVRFTGAKTRVQLRSAIDAARWLLISAEEVGPAHRGCLRERIEQNIEDALERRGAAPSGVGASSDPNSVLGDQLFRAEQTGIRGLVLALGSLESLIGPTGALGDEDSATLRWLAASTRTRSVALWLADTDAHLLGYGPPVSLHTLLTGRARANEGAAPTLPLVATPNDRARANEGPTLPLVAAPNDRARASDVASPANVGGTSVGGSPDNLNSGSAADHLARLRLLARTLDEADGPKPLAVVEKLFTECFLPLAEASARNETDQRVGNTLERFRKGFEKSYTDAFAAAKVTRKRPQMVLDVPHIAARIARLHGARTTALVLVDSMRFDLGMQVEKLLGAELSGSAVLAERMVLWSALPTITPVQLFLIARGPQGLAEPLDSNEHDGRELMVPRRKNAAMLRRLRLGGREIHKLDVARSDLMESGPAEPERILALAEAVTVPLVRFARELQPRTLMLVFGDHGFVLPAVGHATGPALEGGAAPEQVLVPGQAWLVGGVH